MKTKVMGMMALVLISTVLMAGCIFEEDDYDKGYKKGYEKGREAYERGDEFGWEMSIGTDEYNEGFKDGYDDGFDGEESKLSDDSPGFEFLYVLIALCMVIILKIVYREKVKRK